MWYKVTKMTYSVMNSSGSGGGGVNAPVRRRRFGCLKRVTTAPIVVAVILSVILSVVNILMSVSFDSRALSVQENAPVITTATVAIHDNKSIRKWGCHRRETPLIFVHIGKAGGGGVRRRLAGAAQDLNRSEWHKPKDDNHYYPIVMDGRTESSSSSFRRGKFCNSENKNIKIPVNHRTRPLLNRTKSFEGDLFCNATTPFGMAIACPQNFRAQRKNSFKSALCLGCDDDYYLEKQYYDQVNEEDKIKVSAMLIDPPNPSYICDTVYVSHNNLGAELNWLPPRYLKEYWWENSPWKNKNSSVVVKGKLEHYWESLMSDRKHRAQQVLNKLNSTTLARLYSEKTKGENENSPKWCPAGFSEHRNSGIQYHRPGYHDENWKQSKSRFEKCSGPIGEAADGLFREFWKEQPQKGGINNNSSSLEFIDDNNYSPVYASLPLHRVTMIREPFSWLMSKFFWDTKVFLEKSCEDIFFPTHENPTMSWIELYSYDYLFHLCGNDCETRFENKMIGLDGIEAQAEGNLRNSFSVVGLLNESDSFYEMIHKRIDYIDMNKQIDVGKRDHKSHPSRQKPNCKQLYLHNETFRDYVRSNTPAFRALERIYNVGVEVNRFQQEELAQCGD